MASDFKNLQVWEKSHQLTLAVYRITTSFPDTERYSLTSQLRRTAASIPANIAEGCGREGNAELVRFLRISMGSASELEYHLLLAHDLGFVETQIYQTMNQSVTEIKRMLTGLIKKLNTDKK